MATSKLHTMIKIWAENDKICYEEEFCHLSCRPELILDLPPGYCTAQDWMEEALSNISLDELILPDKFEVCEEPVLYEVIGTFWVSGATDYWGEYDEDYDFDLEQWTCGFEEEKTLLPADQPSCSVI